MLPLLLSEARLLIEMLPGLSANISTGFLIFFRVDVYCPLKAMMTTAFSISASSTSCWMTRLSDTLPIKPLTVLGLLPHSGRFFTINYISLFAAAGVRMASNKRQQVTALLYLDFFDFVRLDDLDVGHRVDQRFP